METRDTKIYRELFKNLPKNWCVRGCEKFHLWLVDIESLFNIEVDIDGLCKTNIYFYNESEYWGNKLNATVYQNLNHYTEILIEEFLQKTNTNYMNTEEQLISRLDLVNGYNKFGCTEFREHVKNLLDSSSLYKDNYMVTIPTHLLEKFFNKATPDQLKWADSLGIKSQPKQLAISGKLFDDTGTTIAYTDSYKNLYLSKNLNWEIEERGGISYLKASKK